MVIILDLGGVLMRHNMPECLARFERLLGKEQMAQVLGLQSNAEGTLDSLVDKYEKGDISTDTFVDTILAHSYEGATREEVVEAWNSMHGGIPEERLQRIQRWADAGHHLYMLSNNNDLHWHHVFSNYDLSMFRHCYASHLLHLAKPDPRIYQVVDQAIRKLEECPGAQASSSAIKEVRSPCRTIMFGVQRFLQSGRGAKSTFSAAKIMHIFIIYNSLAHIRRILLNFRQLFPPNV